MKKMIFLMLVGTLFTAGSAFGYSEAQHFLKNVNNDINRGVRTGDLTNYEVRELRKDIADYQWAIRDAERNGRVSRSEDRRLVTLEKRLVNKLDAFLYNRNRVVPSRVRNTRNVYTTQARRTGGTVYCPAPRRNY